MQHNASMINATVDLPTEDGTVYKLRYRTYAHVRYADATGRDLFDDAAEIGKMAQRVDAGETGAGASKMLILVSGIVWAGLVELQPDVTLDEVYRMFGMQHLLDVATRVGLALRPTLPVPVANAAEAGAGGNPTDAASLNGMSNGGLGYGQNLQPAPELTPLPSNN